jgi:hypothetical protein
MFVDRRLGADAWWDADDELEREGLLRAWIFAPRKFLRFPRPSKDAGPDDPAVRDRERGDIVLDSRLFREMRHAGQWPLLLNITTREVANLIVPDRAIARQLRLKSPASRDRVLHLHPAPLEECRLCRDGIATPAVNAKVLAAPRLARERRQTSVQWLPSPTPQPPVSDAIASQPTVARSAVSASARASMLERLVAALDSGDQVTTLASLIAELGGYDEIDEQLLRELLYHLRIEGEIEFERPLGRFSAIRRRSAEPSRGDL